MAVIGRAEAENGEVAVRKRGEGDIGKLSLADFASMLRAEVEDKK